MEWGNGRLQKTPLPTSKFCQGTLGCRVNSNPSASLGLSFLLGEKETQTSTSLQSKGLYHWKRELNHQGRELKLQELGIRALRLKSPLFQPQGWKRSDSLAIKGNTEH